MPQLGHRREGVLLEHRLDVEALRLDHAGLAPGLGGAVSKSAQQPLLLLGAGADPWPLLPLHGLALDLVDDRVERRLVAHAGRVRVDRATVDHQRDLGDMGIRGAAMLLVGELDGGIAVGVEESGQAPELALRVAAHVLRDLDVLALDDRPHGWYLRDEIGRSTGAWHDGERRGER